MTDALALSRASSKYDLGQEVAAGVQFSFWRMLENECGAAGVGGGASEVMQKMEKQPEEPCW